MKVECKTRGGGCVTLSEKHGVRASYKVAGVAGLPTPEILYVWMKLRDGRRLQVFVNRETGLVVVDAHERRGNAGNEFIRRTVPPPLDAETKRKLREMPMPTEE